MPDKKETIIIQLLGESGTGKSTTTNIHTKY